jgi:polyisoprenyl-teichoic acid--peptidoglycan teichoic acid transferase
MRDFQDYTKETRAARWRRWLWSLPVLMAGLIAGVGALSFPVETLGHGADPEPQKVETSPTGWIEKMLGSAGGGVGGPLNILVLGVDKRPSDSREAQVDGTRTDTLMLVRLVPKTGEVKLLSVPRDLLVEVEPGVKGRINAAYTYGGLEGTLDAVENYARVPLSHYAAVDFEGFEAVVDAMGGVEVDIEDEFPDNWRMEEGLQKLNGHRALRYARYRGTACGDLDRIERQQQLVAALRSKAFKWNTVRKVPDIVKVMNENVETDLGLDEGISLGRVLIRRGLNAKMTSNQLKGTPETLPNGEEVLVPNEQANKSILEDFRGDGPNVHRFNPEPRPEKSSSGCQ